jgi:hypothetical protein
MYTESFNTDCEREDNLMTDVAVCLLTATVKEQSEEQW